MKKKIILIIIVIIMVIAVVALLLDKNYKDVITFDGSAVKKELKRKEIEEFELGEEIYYEFEDGIFSSGVVVGKSGDKMKVEGNSIYSNNESVYTSDLVSKLSSDYIAPVACNSKGETGKIQILNNCLVVYTVEDGLPTIMQESSPAPGDITQAPSTDVVYIEVN